MSPLSNFYHLHFEPKAKVRTELEFAFKHGAWTQVLNSSTFIPYCWTLLHFSVGLVKKIQLLRLLLKIGRCIHSLLIWGHNCFLCFFQILIMFNNIQGYWQGQSDMAIVVDSLFLLGGISRHTVAKHIHRHFCQNIHTPHTHAISSMTILSMVSDFYFFHTEFGRHITSFKIKGIASIFWLFFFSTFHVSNPLYV